MDNRSRERNPRFRERPVYQQRSRPGVASNINIEAILVVASFLSVAVAAMIAMLFAH